MITPKNIHKIFSPPKNIHFFENPQNNSEFWTRKISPSLRMCENIRVPPPPPPGDHICQLFSYFTTKQTCLTETVCLSSNIKNRNLHAHYCANRNHDNKYFAMTADSSCSSETIIPITISIFPVSHDFCRLLLSCAADIANNMGPDQTAPREQSDQGS